ncbi:hypothetical protein DICPUDRAFT_34650 [Dictyostelium purpureum]|uniref:Protein kinase domain-containing protein n=1 Tax=Dictyostelium purpureum TaxID=5786 RepID=F0ZN36_DICPU|nr:uncharacterized protein DICPUDRAFT_34650 [Dictyostelium purpureum]EGC34646.1 hypothetical protein DICPUDRAFT_34650 [Dictyostelium purpureum]|eukprot:XP_003288827.1 hypothetical protein DICPUDRAFT_34650 [Dictyostelium purpureum]
MGKEGIHENIICHFVDQCHKGLNFLHDNNIIHRDIKCQNILVNLDFNIKIIDFGISKYTEYKTSTFAGTPTHMSPETRIGKTSFGSDLWSLGCTIIEMGGGNLDVIENDIPKIPEHFSNNLRFMTKLLLIKDPFYRGYPIFKNYNTVCIKTLCIFIRKYLL